MVAWLVDWLMSTRPGCKGTVTANTVTQLETKTWPAIDHWTRICATRAWFLLGTESIRAIKDPRNWFFVAQTAREENSEAFAGQHAATSSNCYIFDEASAVPDAIWEVAEGGLTDGEPHIFAFGNLSAIGAPKALSTNIAATFFSAVLSRSISAATPISTLRSRPFSPGIRIGGMLRLSAHGGNTQQGSLSSVQRLFRS